MSQNGGNAKKARLWQYGLAIYCVVLFFLSMGFLFYEYYVQDKSAISLIKYEESVTTEGIYLIKINSATEEQLQSLPRVGPVLAKSIISYREAHGAFRSFEELLEVQGIGEKTLEALLPLISLD